MAGSQWTLGAAALSLVSCAASGSFDTDVGSGVRYSVRTLGPEEAEQPGFEAIPMAASSPAPFDPWIAEFVSLRAPRTVPPDDALDAEPSDSGPAAIDASRVPAPRLSLDFELGVGCDEGDEDLHVSDVHDVSGISETLLRLSCSYGLTSSSTLVGTMAASQILDETFQDTVADSELLYLAVGVRFQF